MFNIQKHFLHSLMQYIITAEEAENIFRYDIYISSSI